MQEIALEVARNLAEFERYAKYTGYTYRVGERPNLRSAKGYRAHEEFVAFCADEYAVAAARDGANWCYDITCLDIPRMSFFGEMHKTIYGEETVRMADAVLMYVLAGFPECPNGPCHDLGKFQNAIKEEWYKRL